MTSSIDLNADLGEGYTNDDALMDVVTSCNVACGGHAGDAHSMRTALLAAKTKGISAGAHPSFPDKENFGRMPSTLSGRQLEDALSDQLNDIIAIASEVGAPLNHVKAHGALYNMAACDEALALSVAQVSKTLLPNAALVGPPGSKLQSVAAMLGLSFIAEGFADRTYEDDGSLRNRKKSGAMLHDIEGQTAQALQFARHQTVTTHSGRNLNWPVQTLCIHGDTPDALNAARTIRASLEDAGIAVCPVQ